MAALTCSKFPYCSRAAMYCAKEQEGSGRSELMSCAMSGAYCANRLRCRAAAALLRRCAILTLRTPACLASLCTAHPIT